jgi:hypothetical protein
MTLTIGNLRDQLNKTIFPMGYAEDLHSDLYSVYHGDHPVYEGKGLWSIAILHRESHLVTEANIGKYVGLTLDQYKGDK